MRDAKAQRAHRLKRDVRVSAFKANCTNAGGIRKPVPPVVESHSS